MDPNVVESHVLKRNIHTPGTTLLCLENTHNRAGGTVIPMSAMREYRQVADRHGMKVHLDGARVFNAAVALNIPVREIADQVDTVNFCLSKGLRSPVGSVLCGTAKFIEDARIWRKRLGGGMRQAGILAACGIVSLTQMVDRLAEDHRRARALAEMISELPGLAVDWDRVQTNIVLVNTDAPAAEWCDRLHEERVWCFPVAPNRFRLVVHADVGDPEVERAGEVFRALAKTPV
jgi:threonine aldolase